MRATNIHGTAVASRARAMPRASRGVARCSMMPMISSAKTGAGATARAVTMPTRPAREASVARVRRARGRSAVVVASSAASGDNEPKKDEEGADAEASDVEASDVEGNEGAHAGERAHPTIDELKEEVIEEEVEEVTVMGRVSEGLRSASENPGLRNLGGLGFFFLASTFAYSCYKVFRKATSGRARRKRTVNKNVEVVERLKHFFPHERSSLNRGVVKGLSLKTGYTSAEIFRKYLRYKLTEEPFTLDFVADVLALKNACELDGEEMKEILVESGERMLKKYGTLMTNLAGLTQSGMERKIDGAGKFAKLMYLADLDEFIDKTAGGEVQLKLKEMFGATDEDYNKVKITALGSDEVDVSSLNTMIASMDESSETSEETTDGEQPAEE